MILISFVIIYIIIIVIYITRCFFTESFKKDKTYDQCYYKDNGIVRCSSDSIPKNEKIDYSDIYNKENIANETLYLIFDKNYQWNIKDKWIIHDIDNNKWFVPEGIVKINKGTKYIIEKKNDIMSNINIFKE